MNDNQNNSDEMLHDGILPSPLYDSLINYQTFEELINKAQATLDSRLDTPFASAHRRSLKDLADVDQLFLKKITVTFSTDDIKNDEQLADKLKALGIDETPQNISNKIGRGTFSAIFMIQVLTAIGCNELRLD